MDVSIRSISGIADQYDYSIPLENTKTELDQKIETVKETNLNPCKGISKKVSLSERAFGIISAVMPSSLDVRPLTIAARFGDEEWMCRLLESGVKDSPHRFGLSAFEMAIDRGHLGCMKLLRSQTNLTLRSAKDGSSALHFAAARGRTEVMLELQSWGLDINEKNKNGDTPLHIFVKFGNMKKLSKLVEHGGDPKILNNDGKTPADCNKGLALKKAIRVSASVALLALYVVLKIAHG